MHQHIGGHRVAVRPLGARPPEEQLIAVDPRFGIEDRLSPDHKLAHMCLPPSTQVTPGPAVTSLPYRLKAGPADGKVRA